MNEINDFNFFVGGNAYFTVSNPAGVRYVYRIRKKEDSPFFVSLLSGPDNMASYTYIGLLIPAIPELKLTRASKMNQDSLPVKVFNWAVKTIHAKRELPAGYSIQHEGRCCRCGRRLTVPESINSGIGPECERREK